MQKKYLDTHMDPLVEIMNSQDWENPEFYKEYLSQTYHYVFYSCRMLAMAASLTDASRNAFYKRAIQHISEENGHEMLALADLKKMGGTPEEYPESGVTRSMWESQFFKIQRQPTSMLGYVLALELLSVRVKNLHQRLVKAHGEKCVNFGRVHVEEDPDHVDKAILQIESLPEAERVEIWRNYEQSCKMFGLMIQECALRAAQRTSLGGRNQQTRIAG